MKAKTLELLKSGSAVDPASKMAIERALAFYDRSIERIGSLIKSEIGKVEDPMLKELMGKWVKTGADRDQLITKMLARILQMRKEGKSLSNISMLVKNLILHKKIERLLFLRRTALAKKIISARTASKKAMEKAEAGKPRLVKPGPTAHDMLVSVMLWGIDGRYIGADKVKAILDKTATRTIPLDAQGVAKIMDPKTGVEVTIKPTTAKSYIVDTSKPVRGTATILFPSKDGKGMDMVKFNNGKVVELIDRGGSLDPKQKAGFKAQLASSNIVRGPRVEVVKSPQALAPASTPKSAAPNLRPFPSRSK